MKNLNLGYSSLTDKIFIGKLKRIDNQIMQFTGSKEDITDKFISVLFQYIPTGEVREFKNSKEENIFLNITKDKENILETIKYLEKLIK